MKIKCGNYEVIDSGVIIAIKDKPIEITLKDEIEGDFKFKLSFVTDFNDKSMITKFNAVDSFTMKIEFANFDNVQNAGNQELVLLGTLQHRNLYFNYRIFDLADVGKTLMYNFYLEKEITHGN